MDRREELELLLPSLERKEFQRSLGYIRDTFGVTAKELALYGAALDFAGEVDLENDNLARARKALEMCIGVKRIEAELRHLDVADLPWKWTNGSASLEVMTPEGEWITWTFRRDLKMTADGVPEHLGIDPFNLGEKMAKMAREHYRPKAAREIAVKLDVDASAVKDALHEAWKDFAKTPPGWDAEQINQAIEELCKHDMPASLISRFHYVRGLLGLPYWDPDSE